MQPTETAPDVGAQIRKARMSLGLSQVQFALKLGVAERTLQSWEGNTRTPRSGALVALAAFVGLPVSFFYGDEDAPEPPAVAA